MTELDIFAFWRYEACPRGVRGREEHARQQLEHRVIDHRRCCVGKEVPR